ncbi:MAG: ChaB family protein [Gammaproteobacteria bacterium]
MSYEELPDLPADLRDELPRRAQEIYQAAYNRVYETSMASGEDHDCDAAQSMIAEKAHKAALLAVEMEYQKDEQNRWRRAPISEDMDKLPGERAVSAH